MAATACKGFKALEPALAKLAVVPRYRLLAFSKSRRPEQLCLSTLETTSCSEHANDWSNPMAPCMLDGPLPATALSAPQKCGRENE